MLNFGADRCDFKSWWQYESWPIEQAAFVLLGVEPPPLAVLIDKSKEEIPAIYFDGHHEVVWDIREEYYPLLKRLRDAVQNSAIPYVREDEKHFSVFYVRKLDLIAWSRNTNPPINVPSELIQLAYPYLEKLPSIMSLRLIPWLTSWLLHPEGIARLCQGIESRLPGGQQDRLALVAFRLVNGERQTIRPFVWSDLQASIHKKDDGNNDIKITLALPLDAYVETNELANVLAELYPLDDGVLVDQSLVLERDDGSVRARRLTADDWKIRLSDPDGLRHDDLEWMGLDQLVPVDAPKNLRRFALSIINKKSLGRISQSRRAPVNPSSSTIALEDNALNFYTIEVLAEEWGWSRTKVLNYAADGRLEIGLPFSDMTMFAQKDNAEGVRENLALCGVTGILKPPLLGIVRFLNRGDWNESTTIPFVMPLAESPPKIYIIGGPEWEDTPFDPVGLKESMWPWASGITWEPVLTHLEGSDVDGFEIAEPDYAVKLCQFVVTRQEKARFEATNFPTEKLWGQDKHEGSTTLAGSESVKVDPGQDQLKQVEHIEPSGSLVQGGSKMDGNFNPDLMGSTSDATLGRHYRQHMKSLASKNEERSAEREIEWERWRKEANRINDNRSHPVTSKRQLASLVKDSLNLSDSIETIRKKI